MTREEIIGKFGSIMPKDTDWSMLKVGEDGELYCTRCGGARTRKSPFPIAGRTLLPVECKCLREEREQREAEEREKERLEEEAVSKEREAQRCADLYAACGLGQDHIGLSFDTFDRSVSRDIVQAADRARRFCSVIGTNPDTDFYGMYIAGPTGVGKTAILACIAYELTINRGLNVLFTTLPKLLDRTFKEGKSSIMDEVRSSDVILIDDLGKELFPTAEDRKGYRYEFFFDVINTCEEERKVMAFSSNIRSGMLVEGTAGLDPALAYRIIRLAPCIVDLYPKDSRRKQEKMRIPSQNTSNYRLKLCLASHERLPY